MDVATTQLGGHFLVDWGTNVNIDVSNVWDVTASANGILYLAATDSNGDGVLGTPMVDGPFKGLSWSYDLTLVPVAVPVPASIWLFGSGLLGIVGVARRMNSV